MKKGRSKGRFKRKDRYRVYILECNDGTYYTGYTNDLEKRIREHNNNGRGARYTRSKRPVELAWNKGCKNKSFAMRTEKVIKGLKRKDKERIVQGARLDNILRKYKNL